MGVVGNVSTLGTPRRRCCFQDGGLRCCSFDTPNHHKSRVRRHVLRGCQRHAPALRPISPVLRGAGGATAGAVVRQPLVGHQDASLLRGFAAPRQGGGSCKRCRVEACFGESSGPDLLVTLIWSTLVGPKRCSPFISAQTGQLRKATTYWICTFSNNQYQLHDELGSSHEESSFYLALHSGICRGAAEESGDPDWASLLPSFSWLKVT